MRAGRRAAPATGVSVSLQIIGLLHSAAAEAAGQMRLLRRDFKSSQQIILSLTNF